LVGDAVKRSVRIVSGALLAKDRTEKLAVALVRVLTALVQMLVASPLE
jgi:hypothetical protein